MAKVELIVNGGSDQIGVDEYADKSWQEFQLSTLMEELLSKRKVVQRKIDAARKRLKRLTDRLNVIESSWNSA